MMLSRVLRLPVLGLLALWMGTAPAQALDSVRIFLTDLSNPPAAAPEPGAPRLGPGPDEWIITGFFDAPGFSIPTIHHLTLLDAQGHQYPLLIERASLRYHADQIRGLRLACRAPQRVLAAAELRLVWSASGEALAENRELDRFQWNQDRPEAWRAFTWEGVKPKARTQALMMISVQPDAAWHRWWYLLPLVVLGILGLVHRFFPAKERA